jgi:hypothetical protein
MRSLADRVYRKSVHNYTSLHQYEADGDSDFIGPLATLQQGAFHPKVASGCKQTFKALVFIVTETTKARKKDDFGPENAKIIPFIGVKRSNYYKEMRLRRKVKPSEIIMVFLENGRKDWGPL